MKIQWDDESIAELKRLHAEGLSYSEIGAALEEKFNVICSRNSAIGKALRLGLDKRKPAGNRNPTPRGPRRQHTRMHGFHPSPSIKQSQPEPAMIDDQQIPQEQRRNLFDLENHHCRWPVGDVGTPEFFFCGHPSADVDRCRPYCARHAAIAGTGSFGASGSRRPWRNYHGERAA
jgi:GcrA cell cycle regulator